MKMLATGLTGFIGSHVLTELEARDLTGELVALSSREIPGIQSLFSLGYSFEQDYLARNGCEDVEILLHIGAWIPKASADANQAVYAASNVSSTAALLEACRCLPRLKRIVFVSTVDVYGAPEGVVDELTPPAPQTLYGWSKLMCEQMVLSFCADRGITHAVLRLGHVYGEGEEIYSKAMPVMIGDAVAGRSVCVVGDGGTVRSFIHASDVALAIANAVEHKENLLVNVAGCEPLTIDALAQMIADSVDDEIEIVHMNANSERRDFIFDCSVLESTVLPSQIPFSKGLAAEIDYIKGLNCQ